ncbi:MAG: ankyrin repeat domain-containing protein, partial [Verrucomicrobiota bacterium]
GSAFNNAGLVDNKNGGIIISHVDDLYFNFGDRGAEVNRADNQGLTPLHVAILRGRTNSVQRLLAAGADVNAVGRTVKLSGPVSQGNTPLMMAVKLREPGTARAITQMLLANKADVFAENKFGEDLFAVGKHPELLAPLFEKHRYPQLATKPVVTLAFPQAGEDFILATRHEDEARPPLMGDALLSWSNNLTVRSLNPDVEWDSPVIRRKDKNGNFSSIPVNLLSPANFPALRWGDIIEFTTPRGDPPTIYQQRRWSGLPTSIALALHATVTKQILVKFPGDETFRAVATNPGVTVMDPFSNKIREGHNLPGTMLNLYRLRGGGPRFIPADVQRAEKHGGHRLTFPNKTSKGWPETWREDETM